MKVMLESRMSEGKVFQIVGVVIDNLQALILVLNCGTSRSPWSDDRRVGVGTYGCDKSWS